MQKAAGVPFHAQAAKPMATHSLANSVAVSSGVSPEHCCVCPKPTPSRPNPLSNVPFCSSYALPQATLVVVA